MRRATLALTFLTAVMIIFISTSFNLKTVRADANYSIQNVDQSVKVLYNGYVYINDTITLTGQVPSYFLVGFSHNYSSSVLKCAAYSGSSVLPVSLNVPLDDHVGFYAVNVSLPQGASQVFSVGFVLSNNLLEQNAQNNSYYRVNFPAFPALTKPVAVCNGSIILPSNAQFIQGTVSAYNYSKENLDAFTYDTSSVTFFLDGDDIQLFEVREFDRTITMNSFGGITGSDTYNIANEAYSAMTRVQVVLPQNASNPVADDQFGQLIGTPALALANSSRYEITFKLKVESGRLTRFVVSYDLPSSVYVTGQGSNSFAFNMTVFKNVDYYIEGVSIGFALPEGAKLQSYQDNSTDTDYAVDRSTYQETVTLSRQGTLFLDAFSVGLTYEYGSVWSAFRPTIWVLMVAIVGCGVGVIWKRPRAPSGVAMSSTTLTLRPEYLRSFVESYEEKMKIYSELDVLESKVQKGRIPRRRYKVQRMTLEARLNTLSKTLGEFRERMRAAGSHYASLTRQLEVAETEINEVEANLKSIESRHTRGDLSLEAYRKLSGDYQRRKEKAETTIDGILLRLREEIR